MFKRAAKSIAKALLGRYRLLRIYRVDLGSLRSDDTIGYDLRRMASDEEMLLAEDSVIRDHAFFAEGKANAFGLWENGKLACSCVIWDAERVTDAIIGDLAGSEAILVDIVTAESDRQRGFALATLRFVMMEMKRKGYQSLICTIWHNNHASIKTFEKAGWRYTALVAEVFPFGRRFTFRFERMVSSGNVAALLVKLLAALTKSVRP